MVFSLLTVNSPEDVVMTVVVLVDILLEVVSVSVLRISDVVVSCIIGGPSKILKIFVDIAMLETIR